MRIDCGYAGAFCVNREYGTSRQFIIFFRTHYILSGKFIVSSGKQCRLRAPCRPNPGEDRHIIAQRKWRKSVVGQAVLSGGRIAQLFSVCRIMLSSTEMPRHGRRGKEKSSHGGRVSTVSSGIENLGHNSYRHLTAKRSPHDSNACLHHRLMPRIIETIETIGNY